MLDFEFHPSFKKAIYLAIVQYKWAIILLPTILLVCSVRAFNLSQLLLSIFLIFVLCGYVTVDFCNRGLVIFHPQGLEGYSFGFLGTSNHYLFWDEIELVEPYRYFGLPFLLVKYHSASTPLWLPLFLKYQIKLNLLILESTPQDNPLHIALVTEGFFKRVPWYSQVKKHQSDRYILESAYSNKIYNCRNKFFLTTLPWLALLLILNLLIFLPEIRRENILGDRYFYQFTLYFVITWIAFIFILWQLGVKHSYLAIKDEGIEIFKMLLGNHNKSFLPWDKIERVERLSWGICDEFRFYLKEPIRGINFIPFQIHFLNLTKLRRVVMNQTSLDNPLQQAIIKYF